MSAVAVFEFRIGQRVALRDERRRIVVQDHVHSGEAGRGGIFFLPVKRDLRVGFVGHFQQQRAGAAGRIINGGVVRRLSIADADDLRDDAADFGGRVKLPLALAAIHGEVLHQVFIGVAEDVIAVRAVFAEIESLIFKDGDEVGEPVHHLLAAAELRGVVEVGHVGELVGVGQRRDDLLVDLVADVGLALERDHVLEAGAFGNLDRRIRHAGVFVADVFDEQQDQHVVLVLAGVHAAAQFVATRPEGRVEFRFLEGHRVARFRFFA